MGKTWKDNPAAVAISDFAAEVRSTTAIHPERTGWIIRPHHTKRLLQIGHKLAEGSDYLSQEVDTLIQAVLINGTAARFGYEVVRVSS